MLTALGILSAALAVWLTISAARSQHPGSGQSQLESLKEAWTNIGVGFSINYCANLALLPLIGVRPGLLENFWLGCIYTVISLVRQYWIRRRFNARMVRGQA